MNMVHFIMLLLNNAVVSQAYTAMDIMLRTMIPMPQNDVDSKPILYENFSAPMNYTFPSETNCYNIVCDGSSYAENMLKSFYRLKEGPQIVTGPRATAIGCMGFIVFVQDEISLKSTVKRMGLHSKHRILCIIESGNLNSLKMFLKKEDYLFGEAEAALFMMNNLTSGYKIALPLRDLEIVSLKNYTSWGKQKQRFKNFLGRKIVISTRNCSIFVRIGEIKRDGSTDLFQGIEATILDDIAQGLNFTYKFAAISGYPADEPMNSSSSGGVLETLTSGRADMAFCGLWLKHKKLLTVEEPSRAVQSLCITYLVPRPPLKNASWTIVLTPFDTHLWMILTVTVIGFSGLIKCASFVSRKFLGDPSSEYESFEYNMLVVFGILSATSWPKFRLLMSPLKHLISWWILFSILLNNCYSSTLISNLYTPKPTAKPITIDDLVDGGYLWRTEIRFPGETLWDVAQRKYNRWMSRQRIMPQNSSYESNADDSYSKQAVIGAVLGKYFSPLSVESLPEKYLTDFEVMDKCLATVSETYFFRPGSALLADFNARLSELIEAGIIEHYRHLIPYIAGNFSTKPIVKPLSRSSDVHPISVSHISGIFGILGYGYLIALCVLVFEVLYSRLTTSLVMKKHT